MIEDGPVFLRSEAPSSIKVEPADFAASILEDAIRRLSGKRPPQADHHAALRKLLQDHGILKYGEDGGLLPTNESHRDRPHWALEMREDLAERLRMSLKEGSERLKRADEHARSLRNCWRNPSGKKEALDRGTELEGHIVDNLRTLNLEVPAEMLHPNPSTVDAMGLPLFVRMLDQKAESYCQRNPMALSLASRLRNWIFLEGLKEGRDTFHAWDYEREIGRLLSAQRIRLLEWFDDFNGDLWEHVGATPYTPHLELARAFIVRSSGPPFVPIAGRWRYSWGLASLVVLSIANTPEGRKLAGLEPSNVSEGEPGKPNTQHSQALQPRKPSRNGRRGPKSNPTREDLDKRLFDAWETGDYPSFKELAREFGIKGEHAAREAKRGWDRHRQKLRRAVQKHRRG